MVDLGFSRVMFKQRVVFCLNFGVYDQLQTPKSQVFQVNGNGDFQAFPIFTDLVHPVDSQPLKKSLALGCQESIS